MMGIKEEKVPHRTEQIVAICNVRRDLERIVATVVVQYLVCKVIRVAEVVEFRRVSE